MSADLESLFASLAEDAEQARIAPAQAVRRRADRRVRIQATVACLAVAAVVAGTAVGSQWILAAQPGPPVPPATSVAPSPSWSTRTSASSPPPASDKPAAPATRPAGTATRTESPAPALPRAIPDRVFLSAADTWVKEPAPREVPSTEMLPVLCGTRYASDGAVAVRRTMRAYFYGEEQPQNSVPDGRLEHTVTVYRSGAKAESFVAELRAAVRACPTRKADGIQYKHRLLSPPRVGDEGLLIEVSYPGRDDLGELSGSTETRLVSVVRIGDAVLVLYEQGHHGGSSDRAVVARFTDRAAQRLTAWRP